jgi:integrase
VFDIKRDKTAAGTRKVPIHSDLTAIIAARTKGRSASDWLFPDCTSTGRDERSSAVSKRFTTYRISRNVDDVPEGKRNSRVNFHSFRRWFITEAVRADPTQLDVVKQIVGHKQQGMTMGVYFEGFTMDAMRRVVESVKLPTKPPVAADTKPPVVVDFPEAGPA